MNKPDVYQPANRQSLFDKTQAEYIRIKKNYIQPDIWIKRKNISYIAKFRKSTSDEKALFWQITIMEDEIIWKDSLRLSWLNNSYRWGSA